MSQPSAAAGAPSSAASNTGANQFSSNHITFAAAMQQQAPAPATTQQPPMGSGASLLSPAGSVTPFASTPGSAPPPPAVTGSASAPPPPPPPPASSSSATSVAAAIRTGEVLYAAAEKVNSELLAMTYGAIVTQIIRDYKDVRVVNAELDRMGYNIGIRLIDEFLAKASGLSCSNFRETANVIAKVAFKMFLGITAEVSRWRSDGRQCVLSFKGNPLLDFVELPQSLSQLEYSNMIAGCIRGACAMIQMTVTVEFIKDELKGATESEIRLTLKEILAEEYADDD